MKSQFFAILAALLSLCTATPLFDRYGSNCINFTISTSISSYCAPASQIPTSLSFQTLTAYLNALGEIVFSDLVTGTYNTAATYCEPQVYNPSHANTLQFLVHGASYTKGYWFGDYINDRYSWADYASKQGYPILAVDRLGNGDSDHPNPLVDVQYPAQMNQMHTIIQMVREGKIPEVPVPEKIVYVGHSYGSIIGNALNRVWPDDVDCTILTGFGGYFDTAFPAILAQLVLLPADIVQPERYGNLDPGYLEDTNENEVNFLFYYPGGYDPEFAKYDFSIRGTFALGEAATTALNGNTATEYTKPVLIVTGNYDSIFCNQLGVDLLGVPSCSDVPLVNILNGYNYVESAIEWYPNAEFEYYLVPDAGHCWQFHYTASEGFYYSHEWMAKNGF